MTIWDLLLLVRRFWGLTLVLLLATFGATYLALQPAEVWNGRVRVILLAPESYPGNALVTTTQALVGMAGVVARDVDGFEDLNQTVDSGVPLASQGIALGYRLRQPNLGGQWDYVYEEPVLDLQSTGPTLEEAKEQMELAIDATLASLDELQDREAVPSVLLIRPQLSPEVPVYTTQAGNPIRAAAGTALLGVLLTLAALVAAGMLVDRRATRRGGGPEVTPSGAWEQVLEGDGPADPRSRPLSSMRHARPPARGSDVQSRVDISV